MEIPFIRIINPFQPEAAMIAVENRNVQTAQAASGANQREEHPEAKMQGSERLRHAEHMDSEVGRLKERAEKLQTELNEINSAIKRLEEEFAGKRSQKAGESAPNSDASTGAYSSTAAYKAEDAPATKSFGKMSVSGNTINLANGYKLEFDEKHSAMSVIEPNGEKMRVWGDPHIDIGNGDKKIEGDFKDDVTLKLSDGTKITIQTASKNPNDPNSPTFADKVDIISPDGECVRIAGLMNGGEALTIGGVLTNGAAIDAEVADGTILEEGADANTWVLEDGRVLRENGPRIGFAGGKDGAGKAEAAGGAKDALALPNAGIVPHDIVDLMDKFGYADWDVDGDGEWDSQDAGAFRQFLIDRREKAKIEGAGSAEELDAATALLAQSLQDVEEAGARFQQQAERSRQPAAA
jgi:hypothetical protein